MWWKLARLALVEALLLAFLVVPLPGHGEMDLLLYGMAFLAMVGLITIPFVAFFTVKDAMQP